MFDALASAADRLGTIDPTLQLPLLLIGASIAFAFLAAGILLGALWTWALR